MNLPWYNYVWPTLFWIWAFSPIVNLVFLVWKRPKHVNLPKMSLALLLAFSVTVYTTFRFGFYSGSFSVAWLMHKTAGDQLHLFLLVSPVAQILGIYFKKDPVARVAPYMPAVILGFGLATLLMPYFAALFVKMN